MEISSILPSSQRTRDWRTIHSYNHRHWGTPRRYHSVKQVYEVIHQGIITMQTSKLWILTKAWDLHTDSSQMPPLQLSLTLHSSPSSSFEVHWGCIIISSAMIQQYVMRTIEYYLYLTYLFSTLLQNVPPVKLIPPLTHCAIAIIIVTT